MFWFDILPKVHDLMSSHTALDISSPSPVSCAIIKIFCSFTKKRTDFFTVSPVDGLPSHRLGYSTAGNAIIFSYINNLKQSPQNCWYLRLNISDNSIFQYILKCELKICLFRFSRNISPITICKRNINFIYCVV